MIHSPRTPLPVVSLLLAAAMAAAAPSARWCPIPWERIDSAAYLACGFSLDPAPGECAAAAGLAVPARGGEPCAGGACDRAAGCPGRSGCDDASAVAPDPGLPRGSHGRAYCIGTPEMASATRSHPPKALAILSAVVIHSIAAQLPPPAPTAALEPEASARPPTSLATARPPVRGPPSLLA